MCVVKMIRQEIMENMRVSNADIEVGYPMSIMDYFGKFTHACLLSAKNGYFIAFGGVVYLNGEQVDFLRFFGEIYKTTQKNIITKEDALQRFKGGIIFYVFFNIGADKKSKVCKWLLKHNVARTDLHRIMRYIALYRTAYNDFMRSKSAKEQRKYIFMLSQYPRRLYDILRPYNIMVDFNTRMRGVVEMCKDGEKVVC